MWNENEDCSNKVQTNEVLKIKCSNNGWRNHGPLVLLAHSNETIFFLGKSYDHISTKLVNVHKVHIIEKIIFEVN